MVIKLKKFSHPVNYTQPESGTQLASGAQLENRRTGVRLSLPDAAKHYVTR